MGAIHSAGSACPDRSAGGPPPGGPGGQHTASALAAQDLRSGRGAAVPGESGEREIGHSGGGGVVRSADPFLTMRSRTWGGGWSSCTFSNGGRNRKRTS